jgi:peptidoglycan/LPS O-acetylase OafA/YrhL
MSVFVGHIYSRQLAEIILSSGPLGEWIYPISLIWRNGAFGVVLFFLISGYVITLAASRETKTTFFVRRALRIYPSFLFASLLFLYSSSFSGPINTFGQLTLLGDFWKAPNLLEGVDWTLRVEILFYIVVGLSAALLVKARKLLNGWVLMLIFVALSAIPALIPVTPIDAWNTGYLNVFFPIFFGGISLALTNLRTLTGLQGSVLFIASFISSYLTHFFVRPDLLEIGPYLEAAYLIFLISYVARISFMSFSLVSWLSSLTYSTYLFHKWGFYWVRDSLQTAIPTFEFFSGKNQNLLINLIALVMFFTSMSLFVRYF